MPRETFPKRLLALALLCLLGACGMSMNPEGGTRIAAIDASTFAALDGTSRAGPQRFREWRERFDFPNPDSTFPLAAWAYYQLFPDFGDEQEEFDVYAAARLNMVQVGADVDTKAGLAGQQSRAENTGLYSVLGTWSDLQDDGTAMDKNPAHIDDYTSFPSADNPMVKAYIVDDEPHVCDFYDIGEAVRRIYATDTRGAIVITTVVSRDSVSTRTSTECPASSYRDYLEQMIENTDPAVVAATTYPLQGTTGYSRDYFPTLATIRETTLKYDIGMMGFVRVTPGHSIRQPIPSELRWQTYTNLAFGAQGIWYYNFRTDPERQSKDFAEGQNGLVTHFGDPTPMHEEVRALNCDVLAIGNLLRNLRSTGVYHGSAYEPAQGTLVDVVSSTTGHLVGEFVHRNNPSLRYALFVNKDYSEPLYQMTFNLRAGNDYAIQSVPGEQCVAHSQPVLQALPPYDELHIDTIKPGGGVLLALGKKPNTPRAGSEPLPTSILTASALW